jgi:hypothetical protein
VKTLLQNILRIWVTARMASNIERVCGEETLGMSSIDDPSCPWHAKIPIPPAMCVQLEIILYCKFLAPLKKNILAQLQKLIFANKKENWLAIYLSIFVLLHSCALTTQRDYEFGKRLLKVQNIIPILNCLNICRNILTGFRIITSQILRLLEDFIWERR